MNQEFELPDAHAERLSDIEYWWSGHGGFCFNTVDPLESRIITAFKRVLESIPEEDFEVFMAARPNLICNPVVDGQVARFWLPVLPGQDHAELLFIYLSPDLAQYSDGKILSVVAHESAHVVLGHYDNQRFHGGYEDEKAAEDLITKWGFERAYTDEALDAMNRRRRRQS